MSEQPPLQPQDTKGLLSGFRWQHAIMIAGVVMIVIAIVFAVVSPPAATESPPEAQPIQFVEAQTYTEALTGQPRLVNPLLARSQVDRDLASLVFSGLTRVDEYGQPVPDLAEEWTVSTDGLTYTFTLRDDVTWHDGQSFTAADVAFTMSVLRDPDFTGPVDLAAFWRTVETYADDDNTVRFVLTQPLAAFPEYTGIGILPEHLLAAIPPARLADDIFSLAPVGTGRLVWSSAQTTDDGAILSVDLEPYADFYGTQRAVQLETVQFRFYEDTNTAFQALGPEAQGLGGLSPEQLAAALDSPDLSIYSAPAPEYAAIIFNQTDPEMLPFFQDAQIRQALFIALNRQQIVVDVLPRTALVANSPILPGLWAYHPVDPPPYDPAQASSLLDEAGWLQQGNTRQLDGVSLTFTLLVSDDPADAQIGQMVVDAWQGIGVTADLETLDPAQLVERLTGENRDFDAALVSFGQGRLADPDPYPIWHQSQIDSGQNVSGFSDRDISEALEIARKDPNGVRRAELYATFQRLFIERAAAVLLYRPVYHYAVSCQVQGVQVKLYVDAADRFRGLHRWQIASPEDRDQLCN